MEGYELREPQDQAGGSGAWLGNQSALTGTCNPQEREVSFQFALMAH